MQSPVFLINSRHPLFIAATFKKQHSFSLSYGAILPSSLNIIIPSALVYSTHPPVSVYSTVFYYGVFSSNLIIYKLLFLFYFVILLDYSLTYNYKIIFFSNFIIKKILIFYPFILIFIINIRGRFTLWNLFLQRKP